MGIIMSCKRYVLPKPRAPVIKICGRLNRHDANGASAQNPGIARYADSVLKLNVLIWSTKNCPSSSVHGSADMTISDFDRQYTFLPLYSSYRETVPSGATT